LARRVDLTIHDLQGEPQGPGQEADPLRELACGATPTSVVPSEPLGAVATRRLGGVVAAA
jgi:hypothetical protein